MNITNRKPVSTSDSTPEFIAGSVGTFVSAIIFVLFCPITVPWYLYEQIRDAECPLWAKRFWAQCKTDVVNAKTQFKSDIKRYKGK